MLKYQDRSNLKIPIECPYCTDIFECSSDQLTAGKPLLCPHCWNLFECRSRELFAALKHIHKIAS